MNDGNTTVLCEVCGDPVNRHDAHWLHEHDCPNRGPEELRYTCGCDLYAHPDCCPECT